METYTLSHNFLIDLLSKSDGNYLILLDENFKIVEVNTYLNDHLSTTDKFPVGHIFSEMFFPEDFSNFKILLDKSTSRNQTTFNIDLRKHKNEDKNFIWTRWEFIISQSEQGKILVGIGYTIPQKQNTNLEIPNAMNELHVKNEVLNGLFEDHLLGFWFWNLEQTEDQLSKSLFSLLGYDINESESQEKQVKWKKHIYHLDKAKVENQLNDHFITKGKIPFHSEFRILSLKEEIKFVVCYGKVVSWAQSGEPKLMVGGFFDISEKKKSDDIIEKQNQFLKELTFNQSHLMRAKLANILGVLEVINVKKNPQEAADLIAIIKDEAFKLDQVLQESIHSSSALNFNKTD